MDIIIDASCIIAVLLGEEKETEVEAVTRGAQLMSSACLPYEVGNSLTAAVKKHRIDIKQAITAWQRFERIPVGLVEPNIEKAVQIAAEENHYAYDAYYIASALDMELPLYSFDRGLIAIAKKRGITCL